MTRSVVAYVTGHGYGHLMRSLAVLERLGPSVAVHLRTSGRALARARASRGFGTAPPGRSGVGGAEPSQGCADDLSWLASVSETDVGPGVAQRGPLEVDLPATRAALEAHLARWPRLVEEEADALRALGADLVFADVPPIAFAAAARAGVPSVAMSNFTWSWIYAGYAHHDPWFGRAARALAEAESQATLLLALAMGGGLDPFKRRVEVAPVAFRPTRGRDEIRAALCAPSASAAFGGAAPLDAADPRPIVLASFGGFGGDLDLAAVAGGAFRLLVVSARAAPSKDVRAVEPGPSLPHQDLVLAADCVVGKPGYGTVAECLAGPTPMVHVPRGEFRENPALVEAIQRWLPSAPLSHEDFERGRWAEAIARAMASRPPARAPTGDGAAEAAAHLRALLDQPQASQR